MVERSKSEVPAHRRDDTYPDKWTTSFRELWRLASDRKVHIKAGPHLYVGGAGVVEAVRIPQAGEEPRVVWQAPIEGTPHRLLAADGKLFVVTREGSLYAFGGPKTRIPAVHSPAAAAAPPADAWTKTAADILQATNVREGYAVVFGVESGRLAEELVRQSDLYVIAIEPRCGQGRPVPAQAAPGRAVRNACQRPRGRSAGRTRCRRTWPTWSSPRTGRTWVS